MTGHRCSARVYTHYDGPNSPREECGAEATTALFRVHDGITDSNDARWFCEARARAHRRLTHESGVKAEWDGR